ncbi:alpha/beta hydrolase [Fontibacillus sp. BL9]|uniref:alpha/beta hydrolase n=1 Tax=Fontibacillus sp. BL9 TaxID=3389971 RepID=UPI00397C3169
MYENFIKNNSQNVKVSFYSRYLGKDMKSLVYLPKGYQEGIRYSVLYLLHGFSGNSNTLLVNHGLDEILDRLINDGIINPLIVVAPYYEGSYGINSSSVSRIWHQREDGSNKRYEGQYEDYLAKELIEYIERNFSTNRSRFGRFIGGWSMGGFAAFHIAFRNPELYSKVGGMAAGLQRPETNRLLYNWLYPDEESRSNRDPLKLAQYKDLSELEIYINCGTDDAFLNANKELSQILETFSYKVQFLSNSGGHTAKYIQENLENFTLFFGAESKSK